MGIAEYAAELRRRAECLRSWGGSEDVARIYEIIADELVELVRVHADTPLTLQEAAKESGYSEDHLRHLVAEGKITNAGQKGRPRIRRRDLPRKPATVPTVTTYDPDADAAALLGLI